MNGQNSRKFVSGGKGELGWGGVRGQLLPDSARYFGREGGLRKDSGDNLHITPKNRIRKGEE